MNEQTTAQRAREAPSEQRQGDDCRCDDRRCDEVVLVNLTPHWIVFIERRDGGFVEIGRIPPTGAIATLDDSDVYDEIVRAKGIDSDLPVLLRTTEEIVGLPPPRDGIAYITSARCAEAASRVGRDDVYAPNTKDAEVSDGGVWGVYGLRRFQYRIAEEFEAAKWIRGCCDVEES